MSYLEKVDRQAEFRMSLEEMIDPENEVRVIEAYVKELNVDELGFILTGSSSKGRPAFGVKCLLKLYLYGYQNRIRSTRRLAKECERNVELWWLLEGLRPRYRIIADFRKDNAAALRGIFVHFTGLLQDWALIGGQTIAIDSVKIRAQNSKRNNYNEAKIKRQLSYIKKKISSYMNELDRLDDLEESAEKKKSIESKLEVQQQRQQGYEQLQAELSQSGQTQVSTVDKDARSLIHRRNNVEVGYSIQSATDASHCLIAYYEVTNTTDRQALSPVTLSTQAALDLDDFDALADKGYYNASEIARCEQADISTYVAPTKSTSSSAKGFKKEDFEYLADQDVYVCPQQEHLSSTGKVYRKDNQQVKAYRSKACAHCPVKSQCTSTKSGRVIHRNIYQDQADANDERVRTQYEYYRRRQTIVEHPFGTVKRSWGFNYTLVRGLKKVEAEFALIFTAYNMKRAINILGVTELIKRLEEGFWALLTRFWPIRPIRPEKPSF